MIFLLAEASVGTQPEWWQVATGIIAIPAGLIGLVYSWFLVQKTRLETAKLAVEIAEKTKAAQVATVTSPQPEVTRGAILQATFPLLLLRYVLMQLLWTLWGYAAAAIKLLIQGIGLGAYGLLTLSKVDVEQEMWIMIPYLILNFIVERLRLIGEIFIFFAVGWPLFKDLNTIFKINVRKIFFWWRRNA
jgi:hypothetical protein